MDNSVIGALELLPRFVTVPWQVLNAVQRAQLVFWVEQTGLSDLSMLFFEVVHVAALPEVVPISLHGTCVHIYVHTAA